MCLSAILAISYQEIHYKILKIREFKQSNYLEIYRFDEYAEHNKVVNGTIAEDMNELAEPECPDTPLFYPAVLPIAL